MERVGGAYGENGDDEDDEDDEDDDEVSGSGNTTPRVESDESAVVDDAVEGGSYELKDRSGFMAGMVGRERRVRRGVRVVVGGRIWISGEGVGLRGAGRWEGGSEDHPLEC